MHCSFCLKTFQKDTLFYINSYSLIRQIFIDCQPRAQNTAIKNIEKYPCSHGVDILNDGDRELGLRKSGDVE